MKPRGRRSVPTRAEAREQHERDRAGAKAIADRARAAEAAEELPDEIDRQLRSAREDAR